MIFLNPWYYCDILQILIIIIHLEISNTFHGNRYSYTCITLYVHLFIDILFIVDLNAIQGALFYPFIGFSLSLVCSNY